MNDRLGITWEVARCTESRLWNQNLHVNKIPRSSRLLDLANKKVGCPDKLEFQVNDFFFPGQVCLKYYIDHIYPKKLFVVYRK